MGHASDGGVQTNATGPEIKKTAYREWREARVPAMELVFRDKVHGRWAQTNVGAQTGTEAELFLFEHYTRAWFDLWLRDDDSALDRLLAPEVGAVARGDLLSGDFRSAAFLPDAGVDCEDFVRCG